jgi:hypothetical protein
MPPTTTVWTWYTGPVTCPAGSGGCLFQPGG